MTGRAQIEKEMELKRCPDCDSAFGSHFERIGLDGKCSGCGAQLLATEGGHDSSGPDRDGAVEYTPLEYFAAHLSGELSLDAIAVPKEGAARIRASKACVLDNTDRLRDEGYHVEIREDGSALYVYPTDEDLEERLDDQDVRTDGEQSSVVTEQECRVCQSDDPNTAHGDFIMGMCRPCSYLVSGRALDAGESVDEAVRHFRPDTGRDLRTDGSEHSSDESERITASDLRLRSSEDGPVLEIAGELSVLLKTFVEVDDEIAFESAAESFRTDVDSDGHDHCWWIVWPGDDVRPTLSIDPVVLDPDAGRDPQTDGGGIPCDVCGRRFDGHGAALVCCSHRFSDLLPASPAVTGPERGDRR